MNLLPKPLRKEVFYYTSDKGIDELKETTQKFIKDSSILVGKFSSDYDFYLYPSIQLGVYSPGRFDRAYSNVFLYGTLYVVESKTFIKLATRPNNYFIAFFFLFPLLFIIQIAISDKGVTKIDPTSWDLLYAPFFILIVCYLMKLGIRYKLLKGLQIFIKIDLGIFLKFF